MFTIDDNSIYVTRGDIAFFRVTAEVNKTQYLFQPGDVVRVKVYGKKDAENVVLQKDFGVTEETESVEVYLTEEDTKIGEVISKPTDYWYEVELNPFTDPQTIIGYDEDGPKVFKLFPEGDDVPEFVPSPEDVSVIDTELNMTSTKPVQNQAIARAYVNLNARHEELDTFTKNRFTMFRGMIAATQEVLAVERARLDNLVAHEPVSLSQGLEYLEAITDETKAKIAGQIESDGLFATVKVTMQEANLFAGGTGLDLFIIPSECRPLGIGLIYTGDGLEYRIHYDITNKRYYMTISAQSGVTAAPSSAGTVTITYALSNHEIVDVRVGADGVTYATAGESVRAQADQFAETTAEMVEWEQGAWGDNGPTQDGNSYYVRTAHALPDHIISVRAPDSMHMHLCAYDIDGNVQFLTSDGNSFSNVVGASLGNFTYLDVSKYKSNHPGWQFYIVLRYTAGETEVTPADAGMCVIRIPRGHEDLATRLSVLEGFSSQYLKKENIIPLAEVVDGYYDDRGVLTEFTNVKSYVFDQEILGQYECVNFSYVGGTYSDVRAFRANGKLADNIRLVAGQKCSIPCDDIAMLTVASRTYEDNALSVYGIVHVDFMESAYAERPENGLENFSVEVNYHATMDTKKDNGKLMYTDYGVLALPTNYDPSGEPTRLIILCQGTGERTGADTNPLSNHGWSYFLSKGYAVMDMNGMAPEWGAAMGFPVTNQHYCNKYLLQSYKKGYEYVMKKYNLKKEVFMAGISMGGGASALIVQSKILPVIAHVAFCPALSVFKQDYLNPWGGENQQRTIAGQWGFDDWETAEMNTAYFLYHIDKVKGYDNLFMNTIGSTKNYALGYYGDENEKEAFEGLTKFYPVPLKIWHCENDSTVLFRYSEFMVNMIRNADGQAWLRSFATGGHVGGWNNGSMEDTDINGNAITTSVPFYEAVLFMQQYE